MADKTGSGQARRARLLRALEFEPDRAVCERCLDQLDDYIEAQLAGQDYAAAFPEAAFHLDACPECAQAYARLYRLARAEAAGALPAVPARAPDLGFLRPAPLRALADQVRAAARRVGQQLSLSLSPELFGLMRPAPALAAALRSADADDRYAEVLAELEPDDALRAEWPAHIMVRRDSQNPGLCLVEVTVEPPGREWPDLAGSTVVLVLGAAERQGLTDAWGLASFEAVPLEALATMEIRLNVM